MKRMNRILGIALAMMMVGTSLWAQSAQDEWGNGKKRLDWWLGASVGVTHALGENATSQDMFYNYPGVDLQVGTFFTRTFGMRLSLGLNHQMGRPGAAQREGDPETYDTNYRFQVLTGFVDAMVDLTTLFQPRKKYRPTFNMLMYAGAGGLEAFDFDLKVLDWEYYPVDYFDKKYWAAHAGLMASYRFSPHWDWTLEGSYTITDDRYDGVDSRVALSGFVKVHTGLVYHFYNRSPQGIRLTTSDNPGWEPSYTAKDRERWRRQQQRRMERARKELQRRRRQKAKEDRARILYNQQQMSERNVDEVNAAAHQAALRMQQERQQRQRQEAEARLYNER